MDTNDVMERTLAKEKAQYEKCCKVMHIFSIMMSIMFAAATVLCLIVPTVQLIQQSNQGMEQAEGRPQAHEGDECGARGADGV